MYPSGNIMQWNDLNEMFYLFKYLSQIEWIYIFTDIRILNVKNVKSYKTLGYLLVYLPY